MKLEKHRLWPDVSQEICLERYVRGDAAVRPAMLVVPGGGYSCVCASTEGAPIAERFASLGFNAFVLNYRVAPERYPKPQRDILRAVKMIRAHAAEWHVRKDNVAAVGFSAGGHLCACAGLLHGEVEANGGDGADLESGRPDAVLLAYPVITFGEKGHQGSGENLLGEQLDAMRGALSLENRVTEAAPPAFIWHTVEDRLVPWENSLLFAQALTAHNVPCELHMFQKGEHGSQLGYGNVELEDWPEQSVRFLKAVCGFRFAPRHAERTVVLTFDDACRSQMDNAVPLLARYGFGATFFVCRFSDQWRALHQDTLMTPADLRTLSGLGFEIGNHTWSHPAMDGLSPADAEEEISSMTRWLVDAGLPAPVSFAYPGGPYAPNVPEILRRYNFGFARTTEPRPWRPGADDKYRIPSTPVNGADMSAFLKAVDGIGPGSPPVLVFHGVPDLVHPWVDTPPGVFADCMAYLHDNGYSVCGLRDY